MLTQEKHGVLPESTKDESARQEYVYSLGAFIQNEVNPGLKAVYEDGVRRHYADENGREPRDRHEVRRAMNRHPYCQLASSMQRTTQEMLWNVVDESIQRQLPTLIGAAEAIGESRALGTLHIDPDFEMPLYIANNDNHAMPGGYSADLCPGDISAGALYDRGGFIYTQGLFGARMDGLGRAAINFIRARHSGFEPKRILDVGCTAGGPTVALAEYWPEAEVHGIDVGAAVLRYAHARAESLGVAVHYSQQSGERTCFDPESFDLVTCLAVSSRNLSSRGEEHFPRGISAVTTRRPVSGFRVATLRG